MVLKNALFRAQKLDFSSLVFQIKFFLDSSDDLYDTPVSFELVNAVANEVMCVIKTWQSRPLQNNVGKLFITQLQCEAVNRPQEHLHVVHAHRTDHEPEVYGVWKTNTPNSSHWRLVFSSLKARGLTDIPLAIAYDSPGLQEAFREVYPNGRFKLETPVTNQDE